MLRILHFVTKEPRAHQSEAIVKLRESFLCGHKRPILMAPTGFGKTYVAFLIAQAHLNKGGYVLFLCDNLDLAEQARQEFESLRPGMIMTGYPRDKDARVQICTPHSLPSNMWVFDKTTLTFVDECHAHYKIYDQIPTKVIGLSATPWSRGLGLFYDDLIQVRSVKELIEEGYLCPFKAYSLDGPSLKKIKRRGGEIDPNDAAKRYTSKVMANAIDEWEARAKGRHTLVFCCNVAHSKAMAKEFRSRGYNFIHVDGYNRIDKENLKFQSIEEARLQRLKRKEIVQKFKDMEFEGLSNVGIATKGFDCPAISCILDLQPTNDIKLKMQKFGRGLRIHESKEELIYLDLAGNLDNWLPTDPTPTELSMDEKEVIDIQKREDERIECQNNVITQIGVKAKCRSVVNRDTGICASCQFDNFRKQKTCKCGNVKEKPMDPCLECGYEPKKDPRVKFINGRLVEVIPKPTPEDWMRMLKHFEMEKGRYSGWAEHVFRQKFKIDPMKIRKTSIPTKEVLNYIKSRDIAQAAIRRKINA